ncbi:MAG: discoidin domain-containing protein [Phycisphaerales bacterium]|nr:MAG: discoidin domain-containing protein [Phycisphaerales bacterium]
MTVGSLRFVAICLLVGLVASMTYAAGPEPDLLWWRFDEGEATTAVDSSGSGHDGVLSGVTWTPGGADGKGYCLAFAGDGGTVIDDDAEDFLNGLDGVTFALWIKSNVVGTDSGFLWLVEPDGGDNGGLRYDAASWAWEGGTNLIKMTLETTGDHLVLEGSDDKQTTGWQHVAATWTSGEELKLYIDGQLDTPRGVDPPASGAVTAVTTLIVGKGAKDDAPGEGWDGLIDDVRIYSRALSQEEIQTIIQGDTTRATEPVPAGGAADVPRDTALAWTAGEYAQTHDVYFGSVLDDVSAASRDNPLGVLVSQDQTGATYEPSGVLDFGQTYYWRVDEVNGAPDYTVVTGDVWSFTVEPLAYPIEGIVATASGFEGDAGPENTVNGSGLSADDQHSIDADDMWLAVGNGVDPVWLQYEFDRVYKLHEMLVWNYNVQFEPVIGFGLKDVTIEYSTDGVEWMVLGDVEFAQATARADYVANTTVDLGGIAAKLVRITVISNRGGLPQYGLSEVRFLQVPAFAREPQPASGAMDVGVDSVLSWRAGRGAATHEVYFGTDPNALTLAATVDEATLIPDALNFGKTYYWRVDEVNEAEPISVWGGDLWSFATLEYAVIEDFEGYDDDQNRIYDTWLDGWVNETGSTVGYLEAPFAETSIVNSGGQSMPLQYDNGTAPFYSEAEYDLGGMDLDRNGADTLRLFVAGQTPPFFEGADGTILMNGIGSDIWNTADEFRYAHKNLSGDGSMIARIESLADSDVWAKGGVMIRETLEPGSAFAAVYLSGDNGVRYQARLEADVDAVSDTSVATDEQIALREPVWVKIERVGNDFNGYYSTDGENWTAMAWNPQTIAMANDVYIGLALTSHNTTVGTGASFAGVAEAGGVSGTWQIEEIGVAQPTTGNAIEPLYVALEDTAGQVVVVTHPNSGVVGISAWQEWLIPYSDLVGINLNSVDMMYIGVGDRNNPTSGGAGTVFIDDVGVGRASQ